MDGLVRPRRGETLPEDDDDPSTVGSAFSPVGFYWTIRTLRTTNIYSSFNSFWSELLGPPQCGLVQNCSTADSSTWLHVSDGSDPIQVTWSEVGFRGKKGGRRSSSLHLSSFRGRAARHEILEGRGSKSRWRSEPGPAGTEEPPPPLPPERLMEAGSQRRAQFRTLFLFLHFSY